MCKDCSSNCQFLFTEFKMIITAHVSKRKELLSKCAARSASVHAGQGLQKKLVGEKIDDHFRENHTSHKSVHVQRIVLLCAKNREPVCRDKNSLVRFIPNY